MPRAGVVAGMIAAAALVTSGDGGRALADEPKAAASQAAATAAPPRFNAKSGTCSQFLALPADVRGLVVAWTAGRYHTLDRWMTDIETARKVVSGVEQQCETTPGASFRYTVVGEVSKLKK